MSKALDLAISICSGSTWTPGIVHDPSTPLVVGSPNTGEIGIISWNPVLHRTEITAASQSQGDSTSFLSISSLGEFLINDAPLATADSVEEAAALAQAAATAAAASAAQASQSLVQVQDVVNLFATQVADAQASFTAQSQSMAASLAASQQAASDAAASAVDVGSSVSQAQAAAGSAQTAAAEAASRASAGPGTTFQDGTKSAAVYADLARQNALISRVGPTRALIAANFPETLQPAALFKRARVNAGGARVVTIPAGIWPGGPGEAWATYRLEAAGSIQFVGQAGNTTGEVIPTLQGHQIGRARYGTTASSSTISRTIAVPAVTSGKIVIQVCIGWANAVPVTVSCSIDSGLTVVARQSARTPALAGGNPHFCTFEANLAAFAGGDVTYSITAGPDANYIFPVAYVIQNQGAGTPIVVKGETANSGSFMSAVLAACPNAGIILALGAQRGASGSFASLSANLALLNSGNLFTVPTANDSDAVKNANWGYGVGVTQAAGDQTVQANFQTGVGGCGITAICYPPGVGAVQPVVSVLYAGARDTLSELGSEASLWFAPDGRTVFVDVPKP